MRVAETKPGEQVREARAKSPETFQTKTFKTGKADMLTLQPISSEQKSVLQALVSLATRPDQTGRNVWSNSDGYPAWHLECDRAELAAACGVPTNDFEARKALDHAIEALTRVRVRSFEADDQVDCGPALVASKCYADPECTKWIGFRFQLPCLLRSIDWTTV